ncbi:MAG: ShlB/FhaC/HecB family hemolysin secretion/activation protein [Oceanospirillaceae bacterium]|nr:ShlB/FhaC/HecB family hemolysin secretion/activation protein [Oceanospirillaceae bacterium]
MFNWKLILYSKLVLLFLISNNAWAAISIPSSGVIDKSAPIITKETLPEESLGLSRPVPELPKEQVGGPQVLINGIKFVGNTVVSDSRLKAVIAGQLDKEHSFSSLKNIAIQVTRWYRKEGYLMATAFLPRQDLADNTLIIEILEGFLGEIHLTESGRLRGEYLLKYLTPLEKKAINSNAIERQLRLLSDRGVAVQATFSPGKKLGTADLSVAVTELPVLQGNVTLDNKGNKFTNSNRAGVVVQINDPLGFGTRSLVSMVSGGRNYQYFALDLEVPISFDGLVFKVSASDTHYILGEEFSVLDAHGASQGFKLGLKYPWKRSLVESIYSEIGINHNHYEDHSLGATTSMRTITSLRAGFNGNLVKGGARIDWQLLGTFGAMDDSVQNVPVEGRFSKLELSVDYNKLLNNSVRLQTTLNAQFSANNLASAQKMALGGAQGVRAYPQGEGLVDVGLLAKTELSVQVNINITVSGFFDYGIGKFEKHSVSLEQENNKTLSGLGAALSLHHQSYGDMSLSASWRTGAAPSSGADKVPRIWLQWIRPFN